MDFELSNEQQLLKESADRFLRENYSFEARRRILAGASGIDRGVWRRFAEFGWLGLPLATDVGGFGGSLVDVMVLMQAFGRALVVEPYVGAVLLAGRLIDMLGSAAQRANLLRPLVAGQSILAFAHVEPEARFDLAYVTTLARRRGKGFVISGAKTYVLGAPHADRLLVSARTSGDDGSRAGISLFFVDPKVYGVSLRGYRGLDGHPAADVLLSDVEVSADALVGPLDGALDPIERTVEHAIAALCAEAVGVIERANEITLEYLKTREQFGSKIGKFQALQHRMVDLFVEGELARSIVIAATVKLEEDAADAGTSLAAAKLRIGKTAKSVGGPAVQLHGGMGMSQEYPIGHYYRRLLAIDTLFGNVEHHRRALVAATRRAEG
jgi:alkylation response protein AidB-like acyl-CoA dehydrogenase